MLHLLTTIPAVPLQSSVSSTHPSSPFRISPQVVTNVGGKGCCRFCPWMPPSMPQWSGIVPAGQPCRVCTGAVLSRGICIVPIHSILSIVQWHSLCYPTALTTLPLHPATHFEATGGISWRVSRIPRRKMLGGVDGLFSVKFAVNDKSCDNPCESKTFSYSPVLC